MSPVDRVKGTSTTLRVAVVTGICTVATAIIGAWQVAASQAGSNQVSPSDVRQIVRATDPYVTDRALVRTELTQLTAVTAQIQQQLAALQAAEAVDHALLERLTPSKP